MKNAIILKFNFGINNNNNKNNSNNTYIHTYNFICFSRLQKKAAYADVDLLKTYLSLSAKKNKKGQIQR